jgi:hypothetical protein
MNKDIIINRYSSTLALACLSLISVSHVASAALITWNGNGDGSTWSDGANWIGGSSPGTGDTFSISNTTVDYDVSGVNLGVRSTLNNATLNLTSSHSINITAGNTTNPLQMLNNSFINVTGGTHTIAGRINYDDGGSAAHSGGGINIVGSTAVFNTAQLINWTNPTLSFEFDALGVGSINYSNYSGISAASLYVDGTAYTGPYLSSGTKFTLINGSNLLGQEIDSANISIVGLGQEGNTDYGYTLTQDQVSDDVFLTVYVPEPSSTALLGLGGLAMMLRRKRN